MAAAAHLAIIAVIVSSTTVLAEAAEPLRFTRIASVCTRLKRENCEELDRYCVYNDCLIVRNDNNRYRACARACGEALSTCEAACDDR